MRPAHLLNQLFAPDLNAIVARVTADAGPAPASKIQAKANELVIYDEISPWGTNARVVKDALAEMSGDITVRINSPGGDVFDGMAIYRQLLDHDGAVTVHVDGIAASIASVIMLAGDHVEMAPHAMAMIHDPFAFVVGNAADMHAMGDTLDKMADVLAEIYATRAGGDAATWRALMKAETWYTAQEALDSGLATALGNDTREHEHEAAEVAAGFDWSMFRHTPERFAASVAAPTTNEKTETPDNSGDEEARSALADWQIRARHQIAEAELTEG